MAVVVGSAGSGLNVGSIISRVKQALGETSGSFFFLDSELLGYLNSAQSHIALTCDLLPAVETVSIVASQSGYDVPDNWYKTMFVRLVLSSTEFRLLSNITLEDYLSISNISSVDIPEGYVVIPSENKVYLYPTPTNAAYSFEHHYYSIPDILSSNGDIPFNGVYKYYPLQFFLISVVTNMCLMKENGASPEDYLNQIPLDQVKRQYNKTTDTNHSLKYQWTALPKNLKMRLNLPSGY